MFVIATEYRELLQKHLSECGVQTLIHYPTPPHKQQAYKQYNHINLPITEKIHKEVLSIPISPVMNQEEIHQVINACNSFVIS